MRRNQAGTLHHAAMHTQKKGDGGMGRRLQIQKMENEPRPEEKMENEQSAARGKQKMNTAPCRKRKMENHQVQNERNIQMMLDLVDLDPMRCK